jgi:hypothetical protein
MVLSTSTAGLTAGIIKAVKVFVWVLASGALAAGIAYMASLQVNADNLYLVAAVASVNALLAGIGKWLKTINPSEVQNSTPLDGEIAA